MHMKLFEIQLETQFTTKRDKNELGFMKKRTFRKKHYQTLSSEYFLEVNCQERPSLVKWASYHRDTK